MRHVFRLRRPLLPAIITTTVVTAVMMIASLAIIDAFMIIPATWDGKIWPARYSDLVAWGCRSVVETAKTIPPQVWLAHPGDALAASIDAMQGQFHAAGVTGAMTRLSWIIGAVVAGVAVVCFLVTYIASPRRDRVNHLRGFRLLAGRQALRAGRSAESTARRSTEGGIFLAPRLPISLERETRHFLVVGATGSGKSVIIRSWASQILKRGDRAIFHDTKGDVLETMPVADFVLLAPHHDKSAIWDVAADVVTEEDAREFAAGFIPSSHDPVWAAGARELFTGAVVILQQVRPQRWGWQQLHDMLVMEPTQLRGLMTRHYPPGVRYIEIENNVPTRMATSFIANWHAHVLGIVRSLARAWSGAKPQRISARDFLLSDTADKRVLILQRAAHHATLSTAWIGAFVRVAANLSVGPLLEDDPERRIWFVLDEFPQLGRLDSFAQILEKGRSRGVCCILGVQDLSQLSALYGPDVTKTWIASVGTKIVCRIEVGATAKTICDEWAGTRHVSWVERSWSHGPIKLELGSQSTLSRQVQHREVAVLQPSELQSRLGVKATFPIPTIRALVFGMSETILETRWPIVPWPKLRPGSEPGEHLS